jgi:cell pole-organizing protein PopZ
MEEILASIRKIIENNEPGAGKSISPSLPPVYAVSDDDGDDIHLTVEDDFASAGIDDVPPVAAASDPRFVAANSPGPARESEAVNRTMSLADVAARVRAASERNSVQPVSREAPTPRELPPAMAARFAEVRREPIAPPPLRNATPEIPQPAASHVAASAIVHLAEAVVPARTVEQLSIAEHVSETSIGHLTSVEPATPDPIHMTEQPNLPVAEQRDVAPVEADLPKALLSETAGQQVARSFEELVAAIDGSERRSLDEIAQEMLRPMLQEWLDDNLPTLVERLVREEIERVARGPRR